MLKASALYLVIVIALVIGLICDLLVRPVKPELTVEGRRGPLDPHHGYDVATPTQRPAA